MIKLTVVQVQVLTAMAQLEKTAAKTRYHLVDIYEARLRVTGKEDPNGVLKRTTQNTLFRLEEHVPQLVTGGSISMWGLTIAGRALVHTQLGAA